jgi:protein-L-isoaspartate(D-aspartate) O-methyltransferase
MERSSKILENRLPHSKPEYERSRPKLNRRRALAGLAALTSLRKLVANDDPTASARARMVQRHLAERKIKDKRVLEAFRTVPRHEFVRAEVRHLAYEDESIPIGEGQTITPPFDVAFMTEALAPQPTDKVYEVGTGSGYQAAILSRLVKDVYSVEIHEPLAKGARKVLDKLGYSNVHSKHGDGYEGWPDAAPFDAVIVTCAPEKIPGPLVEQLKEGGRMVIPLGNRYDQVVYLYTKKAGKMERVKALRPTLFVPMTGKAQKEAAKDRAERKKLTTDKSDSGSKPK